MEEQLEQSKRRLHFCMALIGGWFGAYAILRFHHFASAVTVNFIEVSQARFRKTGSKRCCVLESLSCMVLRFFWQPACRNAVRAICGCGPFSQMQLRPVCSVFCRSTYRSWVFTSAFSPWASSGACLPENTGIPVPPSFLPTTSASLWMPGSRPIYSGIRTISPDESLWRNAVGLPCRRYCRMCVVGDGVGKLHDPACSASCGLGFCVAASGFPDAGKDRRSL